jgi:hypothetical protein
MGRVLTVAIIENCRPFAKGDDVMVCEEKGPQTPESPQQTPPDEAKERTPEEERKISEQEAKGAPAEADDG